MRVATRHQHDTCIQFEIPFEFSLVFRLSFHHCRSDDSPMPCHAIPGNIQSDKRQILGTKKETTLERPSGCLLNTYEVYFSNIRELLRRAERTPINLELPHYNYFDPRPKRNSLCVCGRTIQYGIESLPNRPEGKTYYFGVCPASVLLPSSIFHPRTLGPLPRLRP